MKIVVTDGYAVNPGDLSWDEIALCGDLEVYEHTKPEDTFERVGDADIIIANKTILNAELIESCPKLKLICVSATGYNNVDIEAANKRNIPVCNAANYSSKSVAQHVLAMVLHVYNRVSYYANSVREGRWSRSRDFTYFDHSIEELSEKTIGIIGFGAIGQEVANTFSAFGSTILIQNHPTKKLSIPSKYKLVSKEEMINSSDIISLHIPLKEGTEGLVDSDFLKNMKKSAILVNTARGPVVDENALIKALQTNQILAACIDVMSQEPPEDSPLFRLENCIVTPHQAWTSIQARKQLLKITKSNIEGFKKNNIQNQVN